MMVFSVISTIIILSIKPTRTMVIQLIERIPAVKAIVIQFDVARFSRTLSVLLKSGVSVLDALNVSSEVVTEIHLRHEAKLLSANVAKGISLGEVLSQHKSSFPMTLIQTIKAGEKTGKLDEVLLEMAEFYEREVDYTLKRFTSLLEPLLMLAVGVAVGAMVITIIAPIYSIVGGLQSTMTR
jgi:type II secretory pathway component PulF